MSLFGVGADGVLMPGSLLMMRSLLRPPPALTYSRGSMAPWYLFQVRSGLAAGGEWIRTVSSAMSRDRRTGRLRYGLPLLVGNDHP
jgi:hypothetical protein